MGNGHSVFFRYAEIHQDGRRGRGGFIGQSARIMMTMLPRIEMAVPNSMAASRLPARGIVQGSIFFSEVATRLACELAQCREEWPSG